MSELDSSLRWNDRRRAILFQCFRWLSFQRRLESRLNNPLFPVMSSIGDHDAAIAQLMSATKLANDDVTVRCLLGDAYRDKGELREALKHYRQAVEYDPSSSTARIGVEAMEHRIKEQGEQ
jgi:tetratricopeptide (TPR) repeat protein